MTVYSFKLILILVFNISVNMHYIYSECICCGNSCKTRGRRSRYSGNLGNINNPQKNVQKLTEEGEEDDDDYYDDEEGGKGTNNQIVIMFNKANNKISIDSKDLDLSYKNIPEGIVHSSFTGCTTFCKLDKATYNSFTTKRKITFKKMPAENTFVLFAVKINENEYYLGCCKNGNSVSDNGLFSNSKLNQEIKILGTGDGLNSIGYMFSENMNLGNIVFTNCFNTSNVGCMYFMFSNCSSLKELNLSNFNTNKVTDMHRMFSGCSSLKELNLSNFNTNNVTDMSYMFSECLSLEELNLSNFNTDKVTDMSCMFYNCSLLNELNLSNFNTYNVTNMACMFSGCSSLKKLNLFNFTTYNVTDMSYMFSNCLSLEQLNLSNFNTNNVKNMSYIFYGCKSLIHLNSLLDFGRETITDNMFGGCEKLS